MAEATSGTRMAPVWAEYGCRSRLHLVCLLLEPLPILKNFLASSLTVSAGHHNNARRFLLTHTAHGLVGSTDAFLFGLAV